MFVILLSFLIVFAVNTYLYFYGKKNVTSSSRTVFILDICYVCLDFLIIFINSGILFRYFIIPKILDLLLVYFYFLASSVLLGVISAILCVLFKRRFLINSESLQMSVLFFLQEVLIIISYAFLVDKYQNVNFILFPAAMLINLLLDICEKKVLKNSLNFFELITHLILILYCLISFYQTDNFFVAFCLSLIVKISYCFLRKNNVNQTERRLNV